MPTLKKGTRQECGDWCEAVPCQEVYQTKDVCRRLNIWANPPQILIDKMMSLGAAVVSGQFIYCSGDFQGWHTNGNVLGQRVYISWADQRHMSGMRFYIDNKYIDSPDQEGWNLRAFTPPVWHSVYANCARASVGFLFSQSSPFGRDILQPIRITQCEDIDNIAARVCR